jgi:hypothetical protein
MSKKPLQAALASPSAIAVHDDRHVLRHPLRVETAVHPCLIRGQFMNSAGIE